MNKHFQHQISSRECSPTSPTVDAKLLITPFFVVDSDSFRKQDKITLSNTPFMARAGKQMFGAHTHHTRTKRQRGDNGSD